MTTYKIRYEGRLIRTRDVDRAAAASRRGARVTAIAN